MASAKIAQAGIDVTLTQGMSFALPYPDCSFDRVLSSLLFHLLTQEQKRRTLHEILRVLRLWGNFTSPILVLFALTFFTWGRTALATPIIPVSRTPLTYKHVCAAVPAGFAQCLALVATSKGSVQPLSVNPDASSTGGGPPYAPSNLHNAYNLPTTAPGTPTVAIADAYNDLNLASNLATYRSQWGLPTCTQSNGRLKIVNQSGGSRLPSSNSGWGLEESLDLDMVSAICENCHILLVEASTPSNANLGAAVNEAGRDRCEQ